MNHKKVVGVTMALIIAALNTPVVFDSAVRADSVHYIYEEKIFDENGSEVLWRGAGGSYLFHTDDYMTAWQEHLPQIQQMGLNTMRLAFAFSDSNINPDYGMPSADILDYAKLDWVLDFLDQNGLRAILDLHNYLDMAGDFGSQKLIDDWVALARRYRGDSRIVGYELFNEPYCLTWDHSVTSSIDVIEAYANLTSAVRVVDPEHIVIWEINNLAYAWDLGRFPEVLKPYLQPNTVLTLHEWWSEPEMRLEDWTPEENSFITAYYLVEARKKFNVPVWLGEFGSFSPFDASNPEWLSTEQMLLRCEEQVIGWNLWMERVGIDKPWNYYLPFFPLKVYNLNLIQENWYMPIPKLTDYVIDDQGADILEPFRIEMWHNNDYVTFKPGIIIRVYTNHKLADGTYEESKEEIEVTEKLTIRNKEGTPSHPADWNIKIRLIGYISANV